MTFRPAAPSYANLFGADLVEFTRQARGAGLFERVAFVGLSDVEALQALATDAVEGGSPVLALGQNALRLCPRVKGLVPAVTASR